VVIAAVLGALQISSVASRYVASGRDQHLARLGAAVVTLTRDLGAIRERVSSRDFPASQVIRVYAGNIIGPENTFSAAVASGTGDAPLQGAVTTLARLLRVENDQ
jgi:hypothetical protein